MTADENTYLNVPYREKDEAKRRGAVFDWDAKRWFVPAGLPLEPFHRWLCEAAAKTRLVAASDDGTGRASQAARAVYHPPGVGRPSGHTDDGERGLSLAAFAYQISTALQEGFPNPVWVRAEIANFVERPHGYVSVELAEHGPTGSLLAKMQASIAPDAARRIRQTFERETGQALALGMKVLLLVEVRFKLQYGLELTIQDVDPSFTIGDAAARIRQILERLTKEGVAGSNKALPAPRDFCMVAVLSPDRAAGLGDFRSAADALERHGLCRFEYFSAPFQGERVALTIAQRLGEIARLHAAAPFDALAVIRGGGARTDLFALNVYDIARAVCDFPAPVFTGIGHERDETILDRVANTKFDTPSKVIGHIRERIVRNATDAAGSIALIRTLVAGRVEKAEKEAALWAGGLLPAAGLRLERAGRRAGEAHTAAVSGARAALGRAEIAIRESYTGLRPGVAERLERQTSDVDRLYLLARHGADTQLGQAEAGVEGYFGAVSPAAALVFARHESTVERLIERIRQIAAAAPFRGDRVLDRLLDSVRATATIRTGRAADEIRELIGEIARSVERRIGSSEARLEREETRMRASARTVLDYHDRELRAFVAECLAAGPERVLGRGYTIVRGPEGRPITTKADAERQDRLEIEFRDGVVTARPLRSEKENHE